MTDDRWTRVSTLFEAALGQDASRRAAFVARQCAGDEALRREVESLLAAHAQADGFLTNPRSPAPPALVPGARLGPYEILGPLGAGGIVLPVRVDRVDLRTGSRAAWRELGPLDPAGVGHSGDVVIARDGESYVYNCQRTLSELYLAEGLR